MRVFLLSAAILFAASSFPAAAQPQQSNPEADRFYEACAGDETADSREHVAACTAAINSRLFTGEDLGDLYLLRSSYYLDLGNFDAQLRDADEAQRLLPNEPEPYFARGMAYARKNDAARALPEFDAAIARDNSFADAYLERGYLYLQRGDDERALTDFSDAARHDEMNPAAFDGRGKIYLKRNQYAEARREFDQAARLDDQDPEALFGRGIAQKRLGDARRGDADIAAAKRIEPRIAAFFEPLGIRDEAGR
jgi:tetratricopeptide (TPR) repeat protein